MKNYFCKVVDKKGFVVSSAIVTSSSIEEAKDKFLFCQLLNYRSTTKYKIKIEEYGEKE